MLPFRVLLITDVDAARAAGRGVVETITRALDQPLPASVGARVAVLVRDKRAPIDDVARTCLAVRAIAARAGALTLVHTHARLVKTLGLDGVHVSSDAPLAAARAQLPAGALLGASRHAHDALNDDDGSVDYMTLSPVFAPRSKPQDTRAPLFLEGLHAVCARASSPVIALGGIDDESARACLLVGARGIAVLGAVMGAHDPRAALTAVLRAIR